MPPRRKTVERARELRRAMSLPEVALWQWMRERPNGLKFRRQHPSGIYVLDFYCASIRLAIEVDGSSHDLSTQVAHDNRRDDWLCSQDMHVLRIKAADVLNDLDSVTRYILNFCSALPLHQPVAGSPPHASHGED